MQYVLKYKNTNGYFQGLEWMGQIQSTDELSKAFSTSNYENILFLKKLFSKFSCGEFEIMAYSDNSLGSNNIDIKPRLIDANELYDYIQKEKAWKQDTFKQPRYGKGKADAYYDVLDIIKQQPIVVLEGENKC